MNTTELRTLPFEVAFRVVNTVSLFGDQISFFAIPIVAVLALRADATEMGYLTAAATLPNLLFALHAGAWVDRRGHET